MKKGDLDIGKQTGPYDTEKVRQRVCKWQADSAGVALAKDDDNVITVEYDNESEAIKPAKRTSKPPQDKPRTDSDKRGRQSSPTKSPLTPRELDAERQAWIRKKSTPRNDLDLDIKHAGAPIKRVVSDAHWRKDRSPTKTPHATPKSDPKSYTIKRTTVYKTDEPSPKLKKDDDGIRVRPMRPDDDGIRVTPMKETPSTRPKERTPKSDSDRPNSSGGSKQRTSRHELDQIIKDEPRKDKDRRSAREVSRDNSDRRRRLRRRHGSPTASEAETDNRSIAQTLDPDDSISTRNARTRKQPRVASTVPQTLDPKDVSVDNPKAENFVGQSRSNAAPATVPVFGNRIEAWLGGTPDSFISDNSVQHKDDDRVTAAPRRRSEKRSSKEDLSKRKDSAAPGVHNNDREATGRIASRSPSEQVLGPKKTLGTISESTPSSFCSEDLSYATSSVPINTLPPDVHMSKHAPGANLRRRFPTTGKRLSTIASAETLQETATLSEVSEQDTIVPEHPGSMRSTSGLKRRLTRHDDLMSVLSLPMGDAKSIVSARSIRTNRTRLEKATLQDLWNEFTADEVKYQRELRTLVDGVIPVLLSCVLSKSDSAVAAGLFGRSATDDATITKPIVDMGVALERLKAHHRRVPKSDNSALLSWAQGATRIYSDYLKAWRMGFQDVVVNLAPADTNSSSRWDDGLLRNGDGDLINGDGERVDVAFLLKRPLVRLKYLAKTFKGINFLAPSSLVSTMSDKYQELVTEARRRSNEERARLEDEAAAGIDPTRARDPQSLALLKGVSIDATRCVHARDYFDLNIIHSSGQQLDCRIEIVIRDDSPGRGNGGDVLICEVSDTGRWLLFPPLSRNTVSARAGTGPGDIVMMIRGRNSNGQDWHELLSLHAGDESTGPEWVDMLGLSPVPPSLARQSSFLANLQKPLSYQSQGAISPVAGPARRSGDWTKEIEIPIGERPVSSRSWVSDHGVKDAATAASDYGRASDPSMPDSRPQHKSVPSSPREVQRASALPSSQLRESMSVVSDVCSADVPGLRRSKATRHRSSPPMSPSSSRSSLHFPLEKETRVNPERPIHQTSRSNTGTTLSSFSSQSTLSQSKNEYSVWMPSSTISSDESEKEDDYMASTSQIRPQLHRRVSSVPTFDPPRTSRRQTSEPNSPIQPPELFGVTDQVQAAQMREPSSAPSKLQKRRPSVKGVSFDDILGDVSSKDKDLPPPKPKRFSIPSFTPHFLKRHRRSSSPLKHEYEPSITTPSSTESDSSDPEDEDDDESITSDSSEDALEGAKDVVSPNLPFIEKTAKATPPESLASLPTATLGPSNSASQAPYRTVPHQATNASKTVASIFSWSDRGAWEVLHPDECVIVVTPGLIEAFDMNDAVPTGLFGSDLTSPSGRGVQPLIAFEVTPLVPLRRGTALDISIRSPPTPSSLIRASNNVMFRSRSAEECDVLYSFINMARINNPTYIALQNARGPVTESTWSAAMDQRNDQRASNGSWFHNPLRRSNTYRSKASRAPSAITDSSVGTMNTAFSALRRFNGNSRLFNIAKSTITSRQGSRSGTSESLSSGASTPLVYDPSQGTPLGITNAKIRLYIRESQNKWRDMGSARLSILLPPRPPPGQPVSPRTVGLEKRILVSGKTRGETLLDVTLGESCFERVARNGIAVSVWEDRVGPGNTGGVLASKANTYMVQHKSERECAYTFGLVGKLRY